MAYQGVPKPAQRKTKGLLAKNFERRTRERRGRGSKGGALGVNLRMLPRWGNLGVHIGVYPPGNGVHIGVHKRYFSMSLNIT
jgi:hypothetical protein